MLRHDPDNNFVGRKEVLDEITSKFRANRANIALWGLGGVGYERRNSFLMGR